MKAITLIRDREIGDATLGHFQTQEGTTLCVTLEERWVDKNGDGISDRNVSRVPAGSYIAIRRHSPAHGRELFELQDVPGRGNIQIHSGNTTKDTLGCILVGSACVDEKPAISESKRAEAKFMAYMAGEYKILIIIVDPPVRL